MLENIKVCYWAMSKMCKGGGAGQEHVWEGIDVSFSTTKFRETFEFKS